MSALKNAHYLAFIRSGARGHLLAAPEVQQELLHRVLHADPLERPSVLLSSPHVLLRCRESTRKTALKRGRHSQKRTSPWKAPKVAAENLIRPGPASRCPKGRKEPERGAAAASTSPPHSPGPAVPCSAGRAPPRPSLRPPPPRLLTERSESEPGEPGAECAGEQLPSLEWGEAP